jgi:hypothetical protein
VAFDDDRTGPYLAGGGGGRNAGEKRNGRARRRLGATCNVAARLYSPGPQWGRCGVHDNSAALRARPPPRQEVCV